ncbi:MAG: hypothetical protein M3R53_00730 [Candidatus Eremiobacteraeota bacterium]|nr:hypothetical protein [Candidatus Eremiobacteraeota bacterium]
MISSARATQRPGGVAAAAQLFAALFDDAGLFPPQEATMPDALRAHASHRSSPHAFLQGTFVVPARRLAELLTTARDFSERLHLSVVVDYGDLDGAAPAARSALTNAPRSSIDANAFELRLPRADVPLRDLEAACVELQALASDPASSRIFLESARMNASLGEAEALAATVTALRKSVPAFVGAKLRTGGLTSDALPASETVARFVAAMRDRGVAWKATAGLHHPIRGVYGGLEMHGFLNVLVAALGAHVHALDAAALVEILDDTHADDFRLSSVELAWRGMAFDTAAIGAMRGDALQSIGSCSLDEPVEGLRELGMLA